MAERVVIAELDINAEAFIKKTADIKKQIDILKADQKELAKAGGTASKAYVQNASDLKVLSQAYNANIKSLAENTKATADGISRQELLNSVLLEEVNSIKEARNQNKLLNKLRNETNVSTAQGQAELKALNDALDSNNAFVKENADAYLKQKINIGNYTESIREAILNGDNLGDSLKATTQGFIGLAKSALAFIATPIGAVIALLAGAFALVKNALDRSEESTNKLKLAFSAITGVFNTVLKALEPLGEFLIDGIVMGFDLAAAAAEKAIGIISKGLSFLGFDEAAKSVTDWSNEIKEGVKASQDLEKAQQNLEKSQRQARLTQLEFQKDAEKLRQIRDDESLSIAERAKANEDLGKILQVQLDAELRIAEQALLVAKLRIEAEGETSAALDAQAEALTNIADIQERITGQESEQLANLNGLRRDAAAQAKEIADKAIADQEQQLNLFIAQQGIRAKTLKEQLELDQEIADKRLEILKSELQNRNITQTEFDTELLNIQNDLAKARAEAVVEEAQFELDSFINKNQAKIDSEQFFSDESLRIEQERIDALTEKQLEFESKRLEQGVISQTEFNQAVNAINEENRLANEEAQTLRDEAQKEAELINLENQRILDQQNFETKLEADLANLEIRKQKELEIARQKGADETLITERFANAKEEIEQAAADAKLQANAAAFGAIAGLLGKESALGKVSALAQAAINIQQGITKAIAQGGFAGIATGAVVAARGAVSVAKIAGINTKFEKGGIAGIDGARHSSGGVPVFAGSQYVGEAEGGEGIGILNRGAYASFMDFNNRFGNGNSRAGFYEGGGIITQTIPNTEGSNAEILSAIQSMPAPIVTVQDIQRESSSFVQVANGANV